MYKEAAARCGHDKLPNGRKMGAVGAVGKVGTAPDGTHIWAIIRCDPLYDQARFGDECRDSKTDSIYLFDAEGNVVRSFGGGMFIWPHELAVDRDGSIWVTDAVAETRTPKGDKRGQQVVKFSPEGKVLMTLGTPGVPGWRSRSLHLAERRRRGAERRHLRRRRPRRQRQQPRREILEGREVRQGVEMGIRIGEAKTGWVRDFILYPWGDPRKTPGDGAEFVAVDKDGNIYGGEPNPKRLQKYVRVKP